MQEERVRRGVGKNDGNDGKHHACSDHVEKQCAEDYGDDSFLHTR